MGFLDRELMELLGTSRSTVASDDDIQQANLEVFKAKSMKEYERLGKMVSVGSENVCILGLSHCSLTYTSLVPNLFGRLRTRGRPAFIKL